MIGWVHFRDNTNIHPVLCYYRHRINSFLYVATTTGYRWSAAYTVPLDTEAEVAALLLQGFTMAKTPTNRSAETVLQRIRGRGYNE